MCASSAVFLLTQISIFCAHTDSTDLTVLLCGWEISRRLGEWVWGVVWLLWLLRLLRVLWLLRLLRLTQIQRDSTKIICDNLWLSGAETCQRHVPTLWWNRSVWNTFSGDFCANIHTFSGDFCVNIYTFSGDFFIWDFLGEEMFCFCGGDFWGIL